MSPHPKHSLSYQLAEAIEARGLSAAAVGRAAGVDPAIVSRFLKGQRSPTLATADRIAAALGLRLAELAPRRRGRPPAAGRPGRPLPPSPHDRGPGGGLRPEAPARGGVEATPGDGSGTAG